MQGVEKQDRKLSDAVLYFIVMGSHKNGAKTKVKTIQKDSGFTKVVWGTNNMQPSTVQWNKLAQNRKQGGGTIQIWLRNEKGGVNVFIARSFIKTVTTHAFKITEF